jgi:hypothetical protein
MNKCYDSLGEGFLCQLEKIQCLFADQVYDHYISRRYGIAPCSKVYNLQELGDLRELMLYNESLDLSCYDLNTYRNTLAGGHTCQEDCTLDFKLLSAQVCNISPLIEKINAL